MRCNNNNGSAYINDARSTCMGIVGAYCAGVARHNYDGCLRFCAARGGPYAHYCAGICTGVSTLGCWVGTNAVCDHVLTGARVTRPKIVTPIVPYFFG